MRISSVVLVMMGWMMCGSAAWAEDEVSLDALWKTAVHVDKKSMKRADTPTAPSFPYWLIPMLEDNRTYECDVQLLVDEKGTTLDVRMLKGCPEFLRSSAESAFKDALWKPAKNEAGEPLGTVQFLHAKGFTLKR